MASPSGSDIQILVDVLGGGSISGESGKRIQHQIEQIIHRVNKGNAVKLKLKTDETAILNQLTNIIGHAKTKTPRLKINVNVGYLQQQITSALQSMPPVQIPCTCRGNNSNNNNNPPNPPNSPRNPPNNRSQNYAARELVRAINMKAKTSTTEAIDRSSHTYNERRMQFTEHQSHAARWVAAESVRTGRSQADIQQELYGLENVISAQERRSEKEAVYQDQLRRTSLSAQIAYDKVSDSVHKYWTKYQDVLAKNPELYRQMESLHDTLMSGTFEGTAKEAQSQFTRIRRAIGDTEADVETLGQKITRVFKDKFGYGVMAAAAASARKAISQLYTNVVELEDAMAQMKIVTGASTKALKEYSEGAADAAKATGRTMTEIMASSTEYARLGYNLEESLKLSETTAKLSNVADIDTAEATSAMTAILKGFRLEASDAEMVGDMMTEVANKYAIDAGELGAALERGGASLAAANNTLAESMALMAAGNAAIQNAETVGKQHCPAA